MQLNLKTWNSININTSPFQAWIPLGQLVNLSANPVVVNRSQAFPFLSTTVLQTNVFVIQVKILEGQSIPTNRELLKSIFNIQDNTRHNLVAEDILDSNRQWYLTGIPVGLNEQSAGIYAIRIQIEEPVWRVVTELTTTWNVIASGSTQGVTNIGNVGVAPKFSITPTAAKTTGLKYRRWVAIYNALNVSWDNPIDITNGGLDTSALVADAGVSNQINEGSGIGIGDTSWAIDTPIGGGLPTGGGTFYMDDEQCTYTSISAGNISGVTRGVGGTDAATHADNTVMYFSKMLANGNDLRIWMDGVEVDRWIYAPNTAATKCWININLAPARRGGISGSIAGTGSVSTLSVVRSRQNLVFLQAAARAPNKVVLIDNEAFTFTGVNFASYQLTGVTRARKDTAMAPHTDPDIILIDHDLWILYGDSSLGTPDPDTTMQPMFALSSTNNVWTYTAFFEPEFEQPGTWRPEINATKTALSYYFTGNQNTQNVPASELGLAMVGMQNTFSSMVEVAQLDWLFSHPSGVTNVLYSGKKYATDGVSWPEVAGLQYLQENVIWQTVQTEEPPINPLVWEAFGPHNVSLGAAYKNIRLCLDGSLPPTVGTRAMIQFDTISVTMSAGSLPNIYLVPEAGMNFIDVTLTNNTTGEYVKVRTPILVNDTLTIDCAEKTAHLTDGGRVFITFSTDRNDWLDLRSGLNTLQYDDAGTGAVTVVVAHRDRTM